MRKLLSLVLLLFVLTACGKYDAATGGAVEVAPETETPIAEPVEPEIPTEIVAADADPESPLAEPESEPEEEPEESVSTPTLSDEEAAEVADWVITATFTTGGMTKVAAVQKLPDTGELKQDFVFPTTNKDRITERLAAKLGTSASAIANVITWVGDAPESHSRK